VTEATTRAQVACPFDHHDHATLGDHYYPMYSQFRAAGVGWSPHHGGFWVASGYDIVRSVLRDHETFSSADGCLLPDTGYRSLGLEQDPPEHTPIRRLLADAVGRSAVLAHEQAIATMIERVVSEFAEYGSGDARALIAEKVPVEAVALIFGLSPAASARVRDMTTAAWSRLAAGDAEALMPITEMLLGEVDRRRGDPRDDFLSALTTFQLDGRPLNDAEIGNLVVGLVIAGHETTMNASTNVMYELACDPELQRRLRAHRDQIPAVIEESLRHRAPVHLFFRTVTRPAQLGGVTMSPGDKIAVLYAAANRDPAHFPDPDEFIADRAENSHVAFGWGIHRCVGSFMAQTELRLLTEALLDRGQLSLLSLPEPAPLEGGHHMGFARLELSLTPSA
jgi:cytochrome P450